MVYFFQVDKDGDVLNWDDVEWDDCDDSDHLKEDSCRARRHQLIFRYMNSDSQKLIKTETVLGITTNSSEADIKRCVKILNELEEKAGLSKTTYKKSTISNKQFIVKGEVWKRYIFTGSKLWSVAPPTHSLYTLLIRLLVDSGEKIPANFKIGISELSYDFRVLTDYYEYNQISNKIISFASNIREIFGSSITRNYKILDIDNLNDEDIYNFEWDIHNFGIQSFLYEHYPDDSEKFTKKAKKWFSKYKQIIKQ
jgi:hypothetical protein